MAVFYLLDNSSNIFLKKFVDFWAEIENEKQHCLSHVFIDYIKANKEETKLLSLTK